ncbi:YciI family protein [Jiangella endophytica]|uniref:YciI family protein n=1 Tax=Jiangella endophytica TaxID=1623398 RepID=UPI000E34DF21|nr:YciI family protein [Jiangella endophytica]
MMLIYGNDETWQRIYTGSKVNEDVMRAHRELTEQLVASGEYVASSGLTVEAARTVRVRDGVPAVTDGPFTEAKEVLAGYYLVDCANVERATQIAARIPEAAHDLVEVRRVMDPADL